MCGVNAVLLGCPVSIDCYPSSLPGVNPGTLNGINRSHFAGVVNIAISHVLTFPFTEAKTKA